MTFGRISMILEGFGRLLAHDFWSKLNDFGGWSKRFRLKQLKQLVQVLPFITAEYRLTTPARSGKK